MTQAAGVCAAGEEAVPTKKTKTVVSTSEIRTSKARVQKVKTFPQQCYITPSGRGPTNGNCINQKEIRRMRSGSCKQ